MPSSCISAVAAAGAASVPGPGPFLASVWLSEPFL